MAFQPVPNVAQVTVHGRVDGQLTINDLYFEIAGGGITPVNLFALTTAVSNWVSGNLFSVLSEDWSAERCIGRDLTIANSFVVTVSDPVTGASASEAAPNNVAACISFSSGFSGRSGRGRNYIPGIPNDQITLNTMAAPFMVSLIEIYSALVGAGTFLAGWQMCVVSRRFGGAVRPEGVPFPVLSVGFTRPYVASMRSRSIGHGA